MDGERWTGRTCPGAVAEDDRFVATMMTTYWPHEEWRYLPGGHTWASVPAWWAAGVLEMKGMLAALERERLEGARSAT